MGLLDSIQSVTRLATQIANPALLKEAANANLQALELSEANLQLQKRVVDLEHRLQELESKRNLAGSLFRNGDFILRDGDPTACCPKCWDEDEKLMHILMSKDGFVCPRCKTAYMTIMGNPGRENQWSIPL